MVALVAVAAALPAQTTVAVPCAADNTLYQAALGDLSNGAGVGVFVGLNSAGLIRRGLVRFDVAAAVPAGAQVLAARLDVNVSNSPVAVAEPFFGHRVLAAWGEGTSVASGGGGNGGPAAANDATWLFRFYPGSLWSSAGGDFASAPSFTATMPALGAFASVLSVAAAADVQSWLDQPATNFGWLLKGAETTLQSTHRLDSRESTGLRPVLTVTYLLPGQNGTWGIGCPTGVGAFTAAWSGAPIGGTTTAIQHSRAPASSLGADFFTLRLDPLGINLLPGCTVWLPGNELVVGGAFATGPGGTASIPFVVPSGFPGYLIVCQSAVLTNTNALGFIVSNAAVTVLQ